MGLEWGPLSLGRINEKLLEREVAAAVENLRRTAVGYRRADHSPSIRKSWQ
jgi:hypothetical protein